MGPAGRGRESGELSARYSPARLERLREEVEGLREWCVLSAAVRERGARRQVQPGRASLKGYLRELSEAQRGWEALLAASGTGTAAAAAALPEPRQEQLLNLLDLGLVLIRRIQAGRKAEPGAGGGRGGPPLAHRDGRRGPGGGGGGGGRRSIMRSLWESGSRAASQQQQQREEEEEQPPPAALGVQVPKEAQPRSEAALDPVHPTGDPEEEEAWLDVLRKKVETLQKQVDALQDGAPQAKVKGLQGKRGVLALALRDFIAKKIWALEQEAETLWDAWFENVLRNIPRQNLGLFQEKVDALKYALREFVADSPMQKKVSALEKMEALRDALQEERGALDHAPLGRDALWEKVTELNFALWEIQLDRTFALQEVVDGCRDALREAPQEGVGALQEKLEAMQEVLRAAPLKELSALHKITGALFDAMVDFPRDAPSQEKQDALWGALQNVPLKEMSDLWAKVMTLWGIPLEMFSVWEKVYNLKVFLWDDSPNRVYNLQENVEALKDALRDALWEEIDAQQEKLSGLWTSVQGFPLNKLVALQDKLNALEERLEGLWNIRKEKLPPLKETAGASHKKLGSLQNALWEELAELPEEEVDALQSTSMEEITGADQSELLPAWRNEGTEVIQRNPKSPENALLFQLLTQPQEASQVNHPIPFNNIASFSVQGQFPSAAFPNSATMPGLQNGQLSCALATRLPLQQPVPPLSSTADVLSDQHQTPLGFPPAQPTLSSEPPTPVSSLGISSIPVAHSVPDVDQMQSTPVGQTTDSSAQLNHSAESDAREASICTIPATILAGTDISPEPWHSSHGTLSATQQGDLSKAEQTINLNVDHEISMTFSHPDGYRRSKGQNAQVTGKLTCEDISEGLLASSEQTVPKLASSEPPHKKQKMDALHSSQVLILDQEMVSEYKKYRKCVLAILNQYKSRVGKLRTKLKQPPDQSNALKCTEEVKALTSTLKKERALLNWFDCFRDPQKSKDDP